MFAQLAGGLLFFSLGMDRQVLRVFAASLAAHPPGTFFLRASSAEAIVGLGAGMFATGMRLAMPVVALLALIDISLALLGRIHQQLQLLTLAFPIKMLAALAFLATIFALFLPVYRAAAERTVGRPVPAAVRSDGGPRRRAPNNRPKDGSEKARSEGKFPVSRELVAALQFFTFAALVSAGGGGWFGRDGAFFSLPARAGFRDRDHCGRTGASGLPDRPPRPGAGGDALGRVCCW